MAKLRIKLHNTKPAAINQLRYPKEGSGTTAQTRQVEGLEVAGKHEVTTFVESYQHFARVRRINCLHGLLLDI